MSKTINDTLIIGLGQAGTTIGNQFLKQFNINKDNFLGFNSAMDSNADANSILLKDNFGETGGSGRNPLYTLETLIPKNEDLLVKHVTKHLTSDIKEIILFSSLGGGTGSALNFFISKNILIPRNEDNKYKIVSVLVNGFEYEGNPVNTNSAVMMNQMYSLSGKINLLPIYNDLVFTQGSGNFMFEKTNDFICTYVFQMINFETFGGFKKTVGGLSTLDKNEFFRILKPQNGFLCRVSVPINAIEKDVPNEADFTKYFNPKVNSFDIRTSKSILIMFRTVKGKQITKQTLENIHKMFPDQVKIFSESEMHEGSNYVEFLANGCDLPIDYVQKYTAVVDSVDKLKQEKKDAKKVNKASLKIGKRSLLNL